jgi:hypothetical protein
MDTMRLGKAYGHNILRHVVQDYVPWFNLFNCFSEGEVVRILAAAHNRSSSFDIPLSSLITPPNLHLLDINGSDFRCQIPEEVPSGLISSVAAWSSLKPASIPVWQSTPPLALGFHQFPSGRSSDS